MVALICGGEQILPGKDLPYPTAHLHAKYSCHYCHFGVSALHCCAKPAGREAPEIGCDIKEQPLVAAQGGQSSRAPKEQLLRIWSVWLCLYSSPCSEFPAALWVSRRGPRLRGTSGPFREGQRCAHIPFLPRNTALLPAVLMLLLILYNLHCQQTNITSLNPQDTAMGGTIP